MDTRTKQVLKDCSEGSLAGTMTFPEIVKQLSGVGCEQYHADFRSGHTTYYLTSEETGVEPLPAHTPIANDFNGAGVIAALRLTQAKDIDYREFLRQCAAAGCVGYFVYIKGRRAIYLGRAGEMHIELFPGAKPATD